MFRMVDRDRSGSISALEFSAWLEKGMTAAQKQAALKDTSRHRRRASVQGAEAIGIPLAMRKSAQKLEKHKMSHGAKRLMQKKIVARATMDGGKVRRRRLSAFVNCLTVWMRSVRRC